jgi:hypothetical protein
LTVLGVLGLVFGRKLASLCGCVATGHNWS